jgi:hypothetical protein
LHFDTEIADNKVRPDMGSYGREVIEGVTMRFEVFLTDRHSLSHIMAIFKERNGAQTRRRDQFVVESSKFLRSAVLVEHERKSSESNTSNNV